MSVRTKDKHIPVHMGGRYTKHPPKKTTLDVFANPGRLTKKEGAVALTGIVRAQPPFFHGLPMK